MILISQGFLQWLYLLVHTITNIEHRWHWLHKFHTITLSIPLFQVLGSLISIFSAACILTAIESKVTVLIALPSIRNRNGSAFNSTTFMIVCTLVLAFRWRRSMSMPRWWFHSTRNGPCFRVYSQSCTDAGHEQEKEHHRHLCIRHRPFWFLWVWNPCPLGGF